MPDVSSSVAAPEAQSSEDVKMTSNDQPKTNEQVGESSSANVVSEQPAPAVKQESATAEVAPATDSAVTQVASVSNPPPAVAQDSSELEL